MKILVLGGNGLIGEAIVRALLAAGHQVVGLGREIGRAKSRLPEAEWISADLARLLTASAWTNLLGSVAPNAIVNSAGALQNSWRDDVAAVQSTSMQALYEAAAETNCKRFVQISATRATFDADTVFMRSKGEADDALRGTDLDWTILRPGLVFAPEAYGGTALLRALAATPYALPVAFPDSPVQTVSVGNVAAAVVSVLEDKVPSRRTYDLVEDEPRPLRTVVKEMRAWLGLPAAPVIAIPAFIPRTLALLGDGLGWLGWRAPLRSTAVTELAAGIRGDPAPWREASGRSLSTLPVTLANLPSTVQERWFARAFFVKAMAVGVLSLFWVATGLIAIANHDAATRVLTDRGVDTEIAAFIVRGGAVADVILGIGALVRTLSKRAIQGMAALTTAYLVGSVLLAPDLWTDPLGPMLKAVPVLALCLVSLALADDR